MGAAGPERIWADGRLLPASQPVVQADDAAFTAGLGCYTTVRSEAGRLRFVDRAAGRLARDARRLGLPPVAHDRCCSGLRELAQACFGRGTGIVRMQASADAAGRLHLVGTARSVGEEPEIWKAATSPLHHGGAGPFAGVKLSGHPLLARVRSWLREQRVDEAFLFDAGGYLVEGSRTNLVVCDASGRLRTPPVQRGCCQGVAREILLERVPELCESDVSRHELDGATEIIATNSVRGARPIAWLDGAAVGSGHPGPIAARLQAALDEEP